MYKILYDDFDFSLLNKNFYDFDKEELLSGKSLEKRLSSSYIDYDNLKSEEEFLIKAVKYITKISFGLFHYITSEKITPIIDLNFKNKGSFCSLDKNYISIDLKLLLNYNIPRQKRVDSIIGIIFHEFYHKRFTIAGLLERHKFEKSIEEYYKSNEKTSVAKFIDNFFSFKEKGLLFNILEDKRIESLGTEQFPGYSFFLENTREIGFFLQKDRNINKANLKLLFFDYIFIKILLPELLDNTLKQYFVTKEKEDFSHISNIFVPPYSYESNELKKFRKILSKVDDYITINPDIIYSKNIDDIIIAVENLYKIYAEDLIDIISDSDLSKVISYENITSKFSFGLPNEKNTGKINTELQIEIDEAIGEILKDMESENIGKNKVEKVTNYCEKFKDYKYVTIIEPESKKKDNLLYNEAYKNSRDICRTLGYLDSKYNRINQFYELQEGELDTDELYGINYNKSIFLVEEEVEGYSLDFGILLDESGSMNTLIRDAKQACLTIILSLINNKHINLFVYGHTANDNIQSEGITMFKYYNTLEKYNKFERIFSAKSRTNNADGFAIEKLGEIMSKSKSKNKILVVISDGQPHAKSYSPPNSVSHTKSCVESLEKKGYYVIQICMDYIENSPQMFKNYIPYSKDSKFVSRLKSVLKKKLIEFTEAV